MCVGVWVCVYYILEKNIIVKRTKIIFFAKIENDVS